MARLNPHGITDQQERFCQEYVANGGNIAKAYRDAGYADASARQNGWRLITNEYVQARIEQLQAEAAERVRVTQDDVLRKLMQMALEGHAQQESSVVKCTELLGKHLGMFPTKMEIDFQGERSKIIGVVLEAFRAATEGLGTEDAERARGIFADRVSTLIR
ncbi:MAG: terminase small subunit [Fimbriimonadaceae bacterium]